MKEYKFNPAYEAGYAGLDNLIKFFQNPSQQSMDALRAAQEMFLANANANRPASHLDPAARPGVPMEAMTPEQEEIMRRRGLLGPGY